MLLNLAGKESDQKLIFQENYDPSINASKDLSIHLILTELAWERFHNSHPLRHCFAACSKADASWSTLSSVVVRPMLILKLSSAASRDRPIANKT